MTEARVGEGRQCCKIDSSLLSPPLFSLSSHLLFLLVADELTWLLSSRLFILPTLRVGTALLSYRLGPIVDKSCTCSRRGEKYGSTKTVLANDNRCIVRQEKFGGNQYKERLPDRRDQISVSLSLPL